MDNERGCQSPISQLHCCLCMSSDERENVEETLVVEVEPIWIPLNRKYFKSQLSVKNRVEKYLSSVYKISLPNEFRQVICKDCFESLHQTQVFFDKIIKGQTKIVEILETSQTGDSIKKRRGRPKKSLVKEKTLSQETIIECETLPVSRRSKRYKQKEVNDDALKLQNKDIIVENSNQTSQLETEKSDDDKLYSVPESPEFSMKQNPEIIMITTNANTIESISDHDYEYSQQGQCNPELDSNDVEKMVLENVNEGQNNHTLKLKHKRRKKVSLCNFSCDICDKNYISKQSLVFHKLTSHKNKNEFSCKLCKSTFEHKALLSNHMFTHYSEKKFVCSKSECSYKSFKNRSSLYAHDRAVHSKGLTNKQLTCENCGAEFSSTTTLRAHLKTHLGDKPFKCQFCSKTFAHKGNMNEHLRIHTKEKPFKCSHLNCEKQFATSSQLKMHTMTHNKTKIFLCAECGKGFNYRKNFQIHLQSHRGEKPEECPTCHKRFNDRRSLVMHERTHTGEKPYRCQLCKKSFSDPSNFTKHRKIHPLPKTTVPGSSTIDSNLQITNKNFTSVNNE